MAQGVSVSNAYIEVESIPVCLEDTCRQFHIDQDDARLIRDSISQMHEEMEEIDQLLVDLRHRKDVLASSLPWAQSLVAPIRRLPRELLLEIFHRILPSMNVMQYRKQPMIQCLSSVCASWRHILTGIPSLWSRWEIRHDGTEFARNSFQKLHQGLEYLGSIFIKSSGAPLTIVIFSVDDFPLALLEMICLNFDRVEHFSMHCAPHWGPIRNFKGLQYLPKLGDHPPLLHTLDIPLFWGGTRTNQSFFYSIRAWPDIQPSSQLLEYLLNGLNLRNLRLDMRALSHFHGRVQVPWATMRVLQLEMVSLDGFLWDVLSSLPSIETLDLHFGERHLEAVIVPSPPIALNHLTTLKLSLSTNLCDVSLRWLTAPRLTALHLIHENEMPWRTFSWNVEYLSSFKQRSRFSLQVLRIARLVMTDQFIADFMDDMHGTLRELYLEDACDTITDALVRSMTWDPQDPCTHGVFRCLKVLSLRGGPQRSPLVLAKLVESRTWLVDLTMNSGDLDKEEASGASPPPPERLIRVTISDDDVDLFAIRQGARKCSFELGALPQFADEFNPAWDGGSGGYPEEDEGWFSRRNLSRPKMLVT